MNTSQADELKGQAIAALERTIELALALGVTRSEIRTLTENTAAEWAHSSTTCACPPVTHSTIGNFDETYADLQRHNR